MILVLRGTWLTRNYERETVQYFNLIHYWDLRFISDIGYGDAIRPTAITNLSNKKREKIIFATMFVY